MARGPNQRPDKGFSRELKKVSSRELPANKPFKGKMSDPLPTFGWTQPIVKPTADAMATPHRLQNQKSVKAARPEFTAQQRAHLDKGKK